MVVLSACGKKKELATEVGIVIELPKSYSLSDSKGFKAANTSISVASNSRKIQKEIVLGQADSIEVELGVNKFNTSLSYMLYSDDEDLKTQCAKNKPGIYYVSNEMTQDINADTDEVVIKFDKVSKAEYKDLVLKAPGASKIRILDKASGTPLKNPCSGDAYSADVLNNVAKLSIPATEASQLVLVDDKTYPLTITNQSDYTLDAAKSEFIPDNKPNTSTVTNTVATNETAPVVTATATATPKPNNPPSITCASDKLSGNIGQQVSLQCTGTDSDNDTLTYSVSNSCSGFAVSNTGLVSGTILSSDCSLEVSTSDGFLSTSQTVSISYNTGLTFGQASLSNTCAVTIAGNSEFKNSTSFLSGSGSLSVSDAVNANQSGLSGYLNSSTLQNFYNGPVSATWTVNGYSKTANYNLTSSFPGIVDSTVTARGVQGIQNVFSDNNKCQNCTGGSGSIATGLEHACVVLADSSVKCWGANSYGQLGDGSTTLRNNPVSVTALSNVAMVAAGAAHSCALITDGTIKCWGRNHKGQLGNGNSTDSVSPVVVSGITNAVSVQLGSSHSCALLFDNNVKCWGYNANYELGIGNNTDQNSPQQVLSGARTFAIGGNSNHACAILTDGSVKCWGDNSFGQLGTGNTSASTTPVAVPSVTNATAISASGNTSCIVSNGTVKCWGGNIYGTVGDGTSGSGTNKNSPTSVSISDIVSISANYYHTCAIKQNGSVFCWGNGSSGALGNGVNNNSYTPVMTSISEVSAISNGNEFSCAITTSGIKCWGKNTSGQLGNGTLTNNSTPQSVNVDAKIQKCKDFDIN